MTICMCKYFAPPEQVNKVMDCKVLYILQWFKNMNKVFKN
jgi:hypothetical protein